MRQLIRWYRGSPARLRVVFRSRVHPVEAHGEVVRNVLETSPRPSKRRILVVCSDNVFRSPVAAQLLQDRLDGGHWEVASAGTDAIGGEAASRTMRIAAGEHGIDLSAHCARQATAEDIRGAALVVAMSRSQVDRLLELDPAAKRRIRLLEGLNTPRCARVLPDGSRRSAASDGETRALNGTDLASHRACCKHLELAVEQLARWIARREARRPTQARPRLISAPSLQGIQLRQSR